MSSLSSTVYNEMSDFFSQMIHSEHFNVGLWSLKKKQSISEAQNHLVSSFLSFSQLDPSLNLLDVGCGSGELLAFCSQNYSIRFGLGLDHSGKLIERAKKKNASSSSLSFLEDDIFCLKNYSHYFDRIFALEVAYHFLDKKQLFEFLKQKLADDGLICLSEPLLHSHHSLKTDFIYEIEEELKFQKDFKKKYLSELIVLGHQFIRHELSEISNHPYYQIPLNQHEKILNELNLRLIEAKNLTSDVIPFFPAFKEKMIPFILSDQTPLHWKKIMLSALVVFYFRYLAFQKGEAGYYFLKIKKTV